MAKSISSLVLGVFAAAALGTAALAQGLNGPNPTASQLKAESMSPVGSPLGFTVMWAVVNSNGTLLRSSGGGATKKLSTGVYEVRFRRNIAACAWTGTRGFGTFSGSVSDGEIAVTGRAGTTNGVFVQTWGASGAIADSPFLIMVAC
ncbi:MAG: hypothetical protein KDK89_03375 [Alphaproteobacteria bacterium]|nr:hypothetical protein [Alphaproteobacteria bacterium]